ncbi:PR domain zinc finger protein 5 [Diaphorina citri]|uniref:PR domain zinc finger protein 5 n=1 Tax=Diaphorina citri TaxID=121845 RepID=A0A1S4ELH4_DIACI|nr:PR domain zinc finger protein 5 [Diaphorina citri]KAI5715223.1 hypothetical protein M8J77_012501 [Diaphorina citri]
MDENNDHINKKLKTEEKTDQPGTIKFEPTADNIDTLTISRICARCRLDFVDSRNLRSHFLKFRNQASFSCELCHKSYVRSDILQEHQRVHMCENLYKCVRCFYSANQIYDIYEHMHSVHKINIDNIFKCPYDDVMFRDKETLFQHIGCHRILDRSSGDSANDSVSEKAVPGRDIKEETASDDEADMLPSTLLECNLDQVERKDPKTEVKIPSTVPPEDKLDDDLVDEILDEIDKSTLIDVDYVKNDMVINTENYSHVNSDNDRSIRMLCYFKNIKCAYCTKIFIVKNDLKNHLVAEHDLSKDMMNDVEILNSEQFECTICNIKFDFAIDLTHHNTREHTKYECEHCNKVYNQSYTLKKHMKTCNPASAQEMKTGRGGVANIVCELCDKKFKRNWNLKQHMQNIHKVVKS